MKRPVILEGGTARNFTAKRIYVRPANGETLIPFVPEDEVTLTTKSINENGVFQASKDGAHGWSSVTVNVPANTSVTGTGPDGKQHTVTTDPDTGELQDEITPVSIVVMVPPNILQYQHGDTIDFTGIVVHAYDSDGVDLGAVPFEELIFPVTVAVYDESTIVPGTASSELITEPASPIKIGDTAIIKMHYLPGDASFTWSQEMTGGTFVVVQRTDNPDSYSILCASSEPGILTNHHTSINDETGEIIDDWTGYGELDQSYTYDGKTVYYSFGHGSGPNVVVEYPSPEHLNSSREITHATVAWTIIYGDITSGGSEQTIPVEWPRTGDGAVLEASFSIHVSAVTGGGGQAGGGAGRT